MDAVTRSSLADVLLSPRERAAASPPNGLDLAGIWCAKEAILKSTGDGLRVDPRNLTLAPRRVPGFGPALESWPGAAAPLAGILLAPFDPGTGLGLVGRVAVLTHTAAATRTAPLPTLRQLAAGDIRHPRPEARLS
jgi:4'-phosphopantetheinyl transferase